MQRVSRATASNVLPAAPEGGTPGYFTGGNPSTGTPATVPGYEWFNGVQEEIMAVLSAAGITPSTADLTQLAQAIRAIAGHTGLNLNVIHYANSGRDILATDMGGLILIAAGVVLTAPRPADLRSEFASMTPGMLVAVSALGPCTLAAAAGDVFSDGTTTVSLLTGGLCLLVVRDDDTWIPLGAGSQAAESLINPGYKRIDGLIVQWGLDASGTAGDMIVTFPVTFPHDVLFATASIVGSCPTNQTFSAHIVNTALNGMGIGKRGTEGDGGGYAATQPVFWLVVGH